MDSSFLAHLDWRFATKAFDPTKKVSQDYLDKILEAVHLAPASYGLQPYHVYVVTNDSLREKLKEKGYNQGQVTDASHFLIFASRTDLDERIEQYFTLATQGDAQKREAMKDYEGMMKGFAQSLSPPTEKAWADRQTYIALGFALAACAELEIDSCPMEGFDPPAYDQILELPANMKSVVCLAIGYRKEDPKFPKVRFSKEDLFSWVK
jgi:nitroreductase